MPAVCLGSECCGIFFLMWNSIADARVHEKFFLTFFPPSLKRLWIFKKKIIRRLEVLKMITTFFLIKNIIIFCNKSAWMMRYGVAYRTPFFFLGLLIRALFSGRYIPLGGCQPASFSSPASPPPPPYLGVYQNGVQSPPRPKAGEFFFERVFFIPWDFPSQPSSAQPAPCVTAEPAQPPPRGCLSKVLLLIFCAHLGANIPPLKSTSNIPLPPFCPLLVGMGLIFYRMRPAEGPFSSVHAAVHLRNSQCSTSECFASTLWHEWLPPALSKAHARFWRLFSHQGHRFSFFCGPFCNFFFDWAGTKIDLKSDLTWNKVKPFQKC